MEEAENYPEHEINSILEQTPKELRDLFNVVNTELDTNMSLTERKASHYVDDDYSESREESICASVTKLVWPRQAKLREDRLVYVPNNDKFKQVIPAEYCVNPDGECNYLHDSLPYGAISSCRQKYASKKLLYLDELERRMVSDLFTYPSCCSCVIKHGGASLFDLRSASNSTAIATTPASSGNSALETFSGEDKHQHKSVAPVPKPSDSLLVVDEERTRQPETRESRDRKEEESSTIASLLRHGAPVVRLKSGGAGDGENSSSSESPPLARDHRQRNKTARPAQSGAIIVLKNNTVYTSSNIDSR